MKALARCKIGNIYTPISIHIKRDEAPLERAQTKKLNVLRKSRTEESRKKGEKVRWFIGRGKVVNGKPRPGGAEEGGQS